MPIPNIPLPYRSYSLGETVLFKEELNICVDFMRTFTATKIRRTKKFFPAHCGSKVKSDLITLQSLISVILILAAGLAFGIFALAVEMLHGYRLTNIQ